jgi:hypothetical protein
MEITMTNKLHPMIKSVAVTPSLTLAQRQARTRWRAEIAQAQAVARAPADYTSEQRYEALSTFCYALEHATDRDVRDLYRAFIGDLESYEATQEPLSSRRTADE